MSTWCCIRQVITTALHMDENVAGVTFLAFANGAADIFSLLLLVLRGDDDDEDDITGVAGMGSILGGAFYLLQYASYSKIPLIRMPLIRACPSTEHMHI